MNTPQVSARAETSFPSGAMERLLTAQTAVDLWRRRWVVVGLGLLGLVAGALLVVANGLQFDAELGGGTSYTVDGTPTRDDVLDALDGAGISSGAEVEITRDIYRDGSGVTVRLGDEYDRDAEAVRQAVANAAGVDAATVEVAESGRGWSDSDGDRIVLLSAISAGVVALVIAIFQGWRTALAALVAAGGTVAVTAGVLSLLGVTVGERHLLLAAALAVGAAFGAVVVVAQYRSNRQRFVDAGLGTDDAVNVSINQTLLPALVSFAVPAVIVLTITVGALVGGFGTVTGLGLLALLGLVVAAAFAIAVALPLTALLGDVRQPLAGVEHSLTGDALRRVVVDGAAGITTLTGRKRAVGRAGTGATGRSVTTGTDTDTDADELAPEARRELAVNATTEQLLSHPARPRKKKRH